MRNLYAASLVFLLAFGFQARAQSIDETDPANQILGLQQQVRELEAQLKNLQKSRGSSAQKTQFISSSTPASSPAADAGRERLKLFYRLEKGATGEDVKVLQKFLASDPAIYPEGLITGFFGSLTESAVKRFQAKIRVDQVGAVGPLTLSRINEILSAAGITGDVPTDLLNSRVKIDVRIRDDGREEVKIEIKDDNSGPGSINSGRDDEDEVEDGDEAEDESGDDSGHSGRGGDGDDDE